MVKQKQMASTLQGINNANQNSQQFHGNVVNRGSGSHYPKLIPDNFYHAQRTQSNNHHHRMHILHGKQKIQALNSDSRMVMAQATTKQLTEDNQVLNLNKSFNQVGNQNLSFLESDSKVEENGQIYVENNKYEQKRLSSQNNKSANQLGSYQKRTSKLHEQVEDSKALSKSEFNIDLIESGEDRKGKQMD